MFPRFNCPVAIILVVQILLIQFSGINIFINLNHGFTHGISEEDKLRVLSDGYVRIGWLFTEERKSLLVFHRASCY